MFPSQRIKEIVDEELLRYGVTKPHVETLTAFKVWAIEKYLDEQYKLKPKEGQL